MPKLHLVIAVLVGALGVLPASARQSEEVVVGLSWNVKDSELVQKWEDYLIEEGERQTSS